MARLLVTVVGIILPDRSTVDTEIQPAVHLSESGSPCRTGQVLWQDMGDPDGLLRFVVKELRVNDHAAVLGEVGWFDTARHRTPSLCD